MNEQLIKKLQHAEHVVIFTGAGISAESGIPTFRDALTGLWENFNANELASVEAYKRNPPLVWGWYEMRRRDVLNAQPNAAHKTIAQFAKKVKKVTVITQNVDDLHERGGSEEVIHLHGSLHHPRCLVCSEPYTIEEESALHIVADEYIDPPKCLMCGNPVRPGVVWFGESLPVKEWESAQFAAADCDVMLVIGTSGLVSPAADLPFLAKCNNALVIQINMAKTELDRYCDENLIGRAADLLPALYQSAFNESIDLT
jgi:NAD-dependent deacetylase